MTNIERLKAAGVLDDTYLKDTNLIEQINKAPLSDQEIQVLKDVMKKLKLDPMQLGIHAGPGAGGV